MNFDISNLNRIDISNKSNRIRSRRLPFTSALNERSYLPTNLIKGKKMTLMIYSNRLGSMQSILRIQKLDLKIFDQFNFPINRQQGKISNSSYHSSEYKIAYKTS